VNYRRRVGESSVTGDLWKAFRLGLRMITLVLSYRFGLHSAARIRWDEKGRRETYVLPDTVSRSTELVQYQSDLVALVEHARAESSSGSARQLDESQSIPVSRT